LFMMRVTTVCVTLALLLACTEVTTSDSRSTVDAAQADAVQAPPEETQDATSPSVDATGAGGDTTAQDEAALQDVSPPFEDVGAFAPHVACDVDASPEASVTACPPPLSLCINVQGLLFFDWGQCVAGWCHWPQTIMNCPYGVNWGCSNGACVSGPTM
jgi:hypothetical protein